MGSEIRPGCVGSRKRGGLSARLSTESGAHTDLFQVIIVRNEIFGSKLVSDGTLQAEMSRTTWGAGRLRCRSEARVLVEIPWVYVSVKGVPVLSPSDQNPCFDPHSVCWRVLLQRVYDAFAAAERLSQGKDCYFDRGARCVEVVVRQPIAHQPT